MRLQFTTRPEDAGPIYGGKRVLVSPGVIKLIAAGIFAAVFLMFTVIGGLVWKSSGASAALMAKEAVATTAVVERLWSEETQRTRENTNGIGTRTTTSTSYYAALRFVDQAGKEWVRDQSVSQADFRSFQMGQAVPLRYAASDPTVVELHEGDLTSGGQIGYWLMIAGAVGLAITLLVLLFTRRKPVNVI